MPIFQKYLHWIQLLLLSIFFCSLSDDSVQFLQEQHSQAFVALHTNCPSAADMATIMASMVELQNRIAVLEGKEHEPEERSAHSSKRRQKVFVAFLTSCSLSLLQARSQLFCPYLP